MHLQEDLFDPCVSLRTPTSESDISADHFSKALQGSDAVWRPVLSDGGKYGSGVPNRYDNTTS